MEILPRLKELQQQRGWSDYKIAKAAGLSPNTVSNIYRRNNVPEMATLEALCKAFGLTLSQFFAENEMVEMTPELKELFEGWVNLSPQQKEAAIQMIKAMNKE